MKRSPAKITFENGNVNIISYRVDEPDSIEQYAKEFAEMDGLEDESFEISTYVPDFTIDEIIRYVDDILEYCKLRKVREPIEKLFTNMKENVKNEDKLKSELVAFSYIIQANYNV